MIIFVSLFWVLWLNFSTYVFWTDINTSKTSNQSTSAPQNKPSSDSTKDLAEKLKSYQLMGQSMYIFTWPLLVIAGSFMDNKMVYWSALWMDTLLWKLWNVMRTFANYIIWLILIFSIFTLFFWKWFEKFNPIKIIPQLAVAAILVNASWFLIWTCVDISTILTYSLWTLPTKVFNSTTSKIDKPVNNPTYSVRFGSGVSDFKLWILNPSKKNEFLPFCSLIWSGKNILLWSKNGTWDCALMVNNEYYKCNNYKTPIKVDKDWKVNWWGCSSLTFSNNNENEVTWWPLMKSLFTLYSSILNIWNLVTYNGWTGSMMLTEFIMKFIFLIALLVPLLAFAIIMVVRTVFLWMYIVVSPLIFLFTPLKEIGSKLLWKKWTLKSLCCMVFLPVFVVFAFSMSVVFLQSINLSSKDSKNTFMQHLWISWTWNKVELSIAKDKKITITVDNSVTDASFTTMFWFFNDFLLIIIKRTFGIWFMWILVFTALKSCELTKNIAGSVQNFAQGLAKSTPIIPVAWWQSIASLSQWLSNLGQLPKWKQSTQFTNNIEPWINEIQRTTSWAESEAIKTYSSKISSINASARVKSVEATLKKDKIKLSETFADIAKLKEDQKKSIAKALWISVADLDSLIKNKPKEKLNDYVTKDYKQDYIKKQLKKLITSALDDWKITLQQLEPAAKWQLKTLAGELWFNKELYDSDGKLNKENAICLLLKLWFKKDTDKDIILKAIADNMEGDKLTEDTKKKLETILNKTKCE